VKEILAIAVLFDHRQVLGQVRVSVRKAMREVYLIVVVGELVSKCERVILLRVPLKAHFPVELVLGINNLGSSPMPPHTI
jgi:hypothetical protein